MTVARGQGFCKKPTLAVALDSIGAYTMLAEELLIIDGNALLFRPLRPLIDNALRLERSDDAYCWHGWNRAQIERFLASLPPLCSLVVGVWETLPGDVGARLGLRSARWRGANDMHLRGAGGGRFESCRSTRARYRGRAGNYAGGQVNSARSLRIVYREDRLGRVAVCQRTRWQRG